MKKTLCIFSFLFLPSKLVCEATVNKHGLQRQEELKLSQLRSSSGVLKRQRIEIPMHLHLHLPPPPQSGAGDMSMVVNQVHELPINKIDAV